MIDLFIVFTCFNEAKLIYFALLFIPLNLTEWFFSSSFFSFSFSFITHLSIFFTLILFTIFLKYYLLIICFYHLKFKLFLGYRFNCYFFVASFFFQSKISTSSETAFPNNQGFYSLNSSFLEYYFVKFNFFSILSKYDQQMNFNQVSIKKIFP